SSPRYPNPQYETSNTVSLSIFAQSVSCGRKTNSASGSTNFLINHGHATRSTLTFSRVIHFMIPGRELEISSDVACTRFFIHRRGGHGVFHCHPGAVKDDDFVVGRTSRFFPVN